MGGTDLQCDKTIYIYILDFKIMQNLPNAFIVCFQNVMLMMLKCTQQEYESHNSPMLQRTWNSMTLMEPMAAYVDGQFKERMCNINVHICHDRFSQLRGTTLV